MMGPLRFQMEPVATLQVPTAQFLCRAPTPQRLLLKPPLSTQTLLRSPYLKPIPVVLHSSTTAIQF